jgi:murein DD-endopeptidase MepM/ murein hydrolase activator NlpD
MMRLRRFSALACAVLLLAACARSGPPAPVEIRGVGAGEVRPGSGASQMSPPPVLGGTYAPPPGYGASRGGIEAQSLGEPNDPYSQSARGGTVAPAQLGQIPPAASTYPQSQPYPLQTAPAQSGQPQQLSPPPGNPTTAPAAVTSPQAAAPSTAPADQGSGEFGWPLRGRLISGYGLKPDGQKNEGLNIAAPMGTSVLASRAGTVAYAGNELRGFGSMVLVRHTGGMFTVYAHLDQISVSKGATVTKGQVVGTVGQF